MRKVIVALLAGGAMVWTGEAAAQTRPGFELAGELFDYGYDERLEGELVAEDDGTFGGFALGYVETLGGGSFLRARLSAAVGSVDYSSEDGELENISQSIGQLELHFGKDLAIGRGATLTPFIGLGSRALIDESGGEATHSGALGYDREVSYAYVPVGLGATLPIGRGARLVLSGQVNWVVGGEATSEFSGIDPAFPDVTVDLDDGLGLEASAIFQLPVGRSAIGFGPFVRHWRIERSKSFILTDPEGSGEAIEFFEPANRTTELGLRLSFAF
jgi:hypothetical protein